MQKLAANLTTMFNEVPFLQRFASAAECGFRGVEFLFPYEHHPEAIRDRLEQAALQNVLFNLPPGDWQGGERGIACLPGRENEFREGVGTALDYSRCLGTRQLHAMAGIVPAGGDREVYLRTYVENLRYAANILGAAGVTLLIEPINHRDIPGYLLNKQSEAADICEVLSLPNVKIQMDCYHMQITEGDITARLRGYFERCGHIQVASVPERQEPDKGELNYKHVFRLLDEIGYEGWVGCEYRPAGRTEDGLGWIDTVGCRI